MQHQQLIAEAEDLIQLVQSDSSYLADQVMRLDVQSYTCQQQFEWEAQALFRDYPQCIGPSCLIPEPGDYFSFADTGLPILVVRDQDYKLNAFVNICSHRGSPLTQTITGTAEAGRRLLCPYHGWSYDLTGKLSGIPFGAQGFPGLDRSKLALQQLSVAEQDGLIFVLPRPGQTFAINEVLGGIGQQLAGFGLGNHYHFGTKRVETSLNWKLNMDTFHEFYHFAALHPNTIATMAYSNTCNYRQFARNHQLSSPALSILELLQQPQDQWQPREHCSFVYYIFPNTVIFVVADHFQTWRVFPLAHDRSVVYHSMYLPQPPASTDESEAFAGYFQMINDVAVQEDYKLVSQIQTGLQANLPRQVIIGRNEPGVQNMHRQIALMQPPR